MLVCYDLIMNKKSDKERAKIIELLCEGNSMRSTSRIANCSINTVTALLTEVGGRCARYQDEHIRNLICQKVEVDEIWSFVHTKAKNMTPEKEGKAGDAWTWVAMDPDTKLIITFYLGKRDRASAMAFIQDLHDRLAAPTHLTADGFLPYQRAVEEIFGSDIDFGVMDKQYATTASGRNGRYTGVVKRVITGSPDIPRLTTNHVERQNLTMRMCIRRFGRRTNAFSKKIENHFYAIALHFMYYNFCRIHKTLRITPAMAAGLTDTVWDIEALVRL